MPKVDSGYTKTQFITNWLTVKKQVYWTTCITFLMRRRWKKSSSPSGRADIKLTHADMAYEAPQLHNKQAKMKPLLSVHYNHGFWFQKIVLVQKYQFF
jgi:hypothetical protein